MLFKINIEKYSKHFFSLWNKSKCRRKRISKAKEKLKGNFSQFFTINLLLNSFSEKNKER